jgi:hypothetical protein
LAKDCGQDLTKKPVTSVPPATLLSRLTENYDQVLVKKAPVQLQDGFVNAKGVKMLYRGLMVPFSRYKNGDNIDYIVGAVNCTTKSSETTFAGPVPQTVAPPPPEKAGSPDSALAEPVVAEPSPAEPGLSDMVERLRDCQALAREVDASDSRSRDALYRALEGVYGFYIKGESEPDALDQLLKEAGLRTQKRAPFTPIVKLVFGKDFDKTRVSEYAATLGYAKRNSQTADTVKGFIETQPGGIKSCVRAERAARRAEQGGDLDAGARAREIISALPAIGEVRDSANDQSEFAILGTVQVLRVLSEGASIVEAILKRTAKTIVQEQNGSNFDAAASEGIAPQSAAASGPR